MYQAQTGAAAATLSGRARALVALVSAPLIAMPIGQRRGAFISASTPAASFRASGTVASAIVAVSPRAALTIVTPQLSPHRWPGALLQSDEMRRRTRKMPHDDFIIFV
jgi:hypothetical protein